jgi:hypothetical protein
MVQASTVRASNGINSITRAFLEEINADTGPQLYELSPKDARAVFLKIQAIDVPKLPVDIKDREFPTSPSGKVSV